MKRLILVASIALVACGKKVPDMMPMDSNGNPVSAATAMQAQAQGRFTVTRNMTFRDDLAYGDMRGVYIIVDERTGKEFIGVSGIGIAETGRHHSGKTSREDER